MCGRYLIDEEAYSDILEILYRLGTIPDTKHSTAAGGAAAGYTGGAGTAANAAAGGVAAGYTGGAGTAANAAAGGVGSEGLPPAIREAMAATMADRVSETVPDAFRDLFPGGAPIVTNGEVFPTNIAPVLTSGGTAAIKWGFPHWKNSSVIINARAETALEKKLFRKPLLERRCVILSNGYYEWGEGSRDSGNIQISLLGSNENFSNRHGGRIKKVKHLLRRRDEGKLYMAGFWNTFRDGTGTEYDAFTILTTAANASVAPIHNRMPLILSPDEREDWLGDTGFMEYALLRPGPELEAVQVA